ncbi:MAG: hypothetical protein KAW39_00920 [Thermoplasmata archaeon]|nr:hypothetical protein [Thermoplasmata archaeon]
MALKGKGRLHEPVKGRFMLYIPTDVHKDSAFPFKAKEEVEVEIAGKELVVRKLRR